MSEIITLEQWIAELAKIDNAPGEGITTYEIHQATGISQETIRKRLRPGIDAGLIRVTRKRGIDISGKSTLIPSYVFIKPAQQKVA